MIIDTEPTEPYVSEEDMAAKLLKEGALFINSRKYIASFPDEPLQIVGPETLVLFVACNDVWDYAIADAEHVTMDELPDLYRAHIQNPQFGSTAWACKKRERRPIPPLEGAMREAGCWDDEMEALTR